MVQRILKTLIERTLKVALKAWKSFLISSTLLPSVLKIGQEVLINLGERDFSAF